MPVDLSICVKYPKAVIGAFRDLAPGVPHETVCLLWKLLAEGMASSDIVGHDDIWLELDGHRQDQWNSKQCTVTLYLT